MTKDFNPIPVEQKWQKKWEEAGVHLTNLAEAQDPFYAMVMFPYPSGDKLHVGHWYNFAPADSFARYQRMLGKDVFEPMGFDAFGLPAENYAIKTGIHPNESIKANVLTMIEQLKRMGCMYDWDKTLNTSQPEYYQWTQWLFLQMFKNGLSYKKLGNVNWCPKDQTVLANEQVTDGKCERCGTDVIQKPLEQWYWKITQYADRLIDGLADLDWPNKTKIMQTNWIGRSEGAEIEFNLNIARGSRGINSPATRCVHLVLTPKNRSEFFEDETEARSILRILDSVARRHDIVIHEAAAMNGHVHLLISFDRSRDLGTDIVKKLKGASAREYLKKFDGELQHLWGEGVHHENVDSDKQFHTTLEYIQQNPEKSDISSEGRILSQLPLSITIFTTRPDTLFGATYMVLAPEHPLVDVITFDVHRAEVDAYKKLASKKTEIQRKELNKDKSGVFTGAYAINPVNNEKMPIWIADYVLTNYGTGAIMAVPGHDERDWEFAKKYNLPILEVVKGGKVHEAVYTGDGEMVNSDFVNGLKTEEARKKMIEWLEEKGIGKKIVNFRLRDWLVSRQRYWGAPIPIVYDPQGNAHPVPEEHLPWLLPTDVEFRPNGESPLRLSKEFVERTEKIFGKGWRPEYDTMDTFVCSSFYYLRYLMADSSDEEKNQKPKTKNQKLSEQFIEKKLEEKWMPVDMYIGGPEHATMHLIYARFVMMALHDFGIVSHDEPFQKLVHQGLITKDGAKMSKSKGNVVSPDDYVDRYGADVFRMFLMFMGPFTDGGDWSDTGIKGIDRFVQRAWKLVTEKVTDAADDKKVLTALHASIKKVTESIEKLHFNTAISSLMEFLNAAEAHGAISKESAETFALLLAPLAPHLAEEMWEHLGHTDFIVKKTWPAFDPALLVSDTLTIAIQVNGKLRATIEVAAGATKDEVLALAKDHENVKKYIDGGIKKEIYVPGKLVSLVV